MLNYRGQSSPYAITTIILFLAAIFCTYLAIVRNLALAISSREEEGELEAFGRAKQLVEGNELQGFLLNLLFGILSFAVFMYWEQTLI